MRLALILNKFNIVKNFDFKTENFKKEKEEIYLTLLMELALIENRPKFIDYFIEQKSDKLDLYAFTTMSRLNHIYSSLATVILFFTYVF